MNVYKRKQRWNFFLFLIAILIGLVSLWYTNRLTARMAHEEQKKAVMMADAWTQIINAGDNDINLGFYARIIEENEAVPVIVVDSADNILFHNNLDSAKLGSPRYLTRKLELMKKNTAPIVIEITPQQKQFLYFNQSLILSQLVYYPYIQFGIILLFISVAFMAFRASRKFEQNQLWVGLSKETAHQLGTPISSLLAWLEMMKLRVRDEELLAELQKDVSRLEKITERFSKIGSAPVLVSENMVQLIQQAVNYLKTRSSGKIRFTLRMPSDDIHLPMNAALFEWVIENLCKNAMDALNGSGEIEIAVTDLTQVVYIDISDTGKGIPKSMFKTIFKPGYTTKKKGWGLGLSLAKRIVEEYHDGRIFVHQSELNKGSIFRIVLKK